MDIEEYKRHASLCVRCSYCKYIDMNWVNSLRFSRQCPIDTKYAFNLYSPQGFCYSAQAEEKGTLEFTPKLIDALFHCTLCGACDSRCKRNLDIEVLQVIETLRARCVEKGHLLPAHKAMADNVRKTGNEYGLPPEQRFAWVPKSYKPAPEADIIYFVGCNAAYKQPELAVATVELLTKAGVPFRLLADETCDGNDITATGQLDLARELAAHNVKAIETSGAKTVITGSAECYKSLKVDYPKLLKKSTKDMPYTVLHITEYFSQLIKDGEFTFNNIIPMKVTYHDSCNLGRLSEPWQEWEPKYDGTIPLGKEWRRGDRGIYDSPRDVLKSIPALELVEMERNRSNAWSVGSTGGVPQAFPDFALWTAGERVEEAIATGAEAIITPSPAEKELLLKAVDDKKAAMKVYDITEIMVRAL
ncbi:MAG: (Fe-S)-binding protein [Dehalococcoidales bacterium]|nr:(Fe-S)-binding protein [Dehalococcoidales bacterium]